MESSASPAAEAHVPGAAWVPVECEPTGSAAVTASPSKPAAARPWSSPAAVSFTPGKRSCGDSNETNTPKRVRSQPGADGCLSPAAAVFLAQSARKSPASGSGMESVRDGALSHQLAQSALPPSASQPAAMQGGGLSPAAAASDLEPTGKDAPRGLSIVATRHDTCCT